MVQCVLSLVLYVYYLNCIKPKLVLQSRNHWRSGCLQVSIKYSYWTSVYRRTQNTLTPFAPSLPMFLKPCADNSLLYSSFRISKWNTFRKLSANWWSRNKKAEKTKGRAKEEIKLKQLGFKPRYLDHYVDLNVTKLLSKLCLIIINKTIVLYL